MYESRFGLRRRPFPPGPDSRHYYPATAHERALARLHSTLTDDGGLAVLTGGPGTGKTLLCHCLLERLGERFVTALVTNSHLPDRAALFQAVLFDLGQPHEGGTEQELRLRLTDLLLKNYAAGRRAVLVVDEAQHLSPDLLEELRLLGNLEGGDGKALQVVLVGLEGLAETLRRPALAALSQRVAARAALAPLGVEEAADYLLHHLRAAGGRAERIVTVEALELLAAQTGGVPRLLNLATHQALLAAHAADASVVDVEAALEALEALGLAEGDGEAETPPEGEAVAAADKSPAVLVSPEVGLVELAAVPVSPAGCRLYEIPGTPA